MGTRAITNIKRVQTRIKLGASQYLRLVALANTVVEKMTGNANFATPAPSLASVTTAAGDLATAAGNMGIRRSRGSKSSLITAQAYATDLRALLSQLEAYVINTAAIAALPDSPAYNVIVASSGFALRTPARKVQLQTMRYVRQDNNPAFNLEKVRLNWRKPKGLIKGAHATAYEIKSKGQIVAVTTRTNFEVPFTKDYDSPLEITPMNSRGKGVPFFVFFLRSNTPA